MAKMFSKLTYPLELAIFKTAVSYYSMAPLGTSPVILMTV